MVQACLISIVNMVQLVIGAIENMSISGELEDGYTEGVLSVKCIKHKKTDLMSVYLDKEKDVVWYRYCPVCGLMYHPISS